LAESGAARTQVERHFDKQQQCVASNFCTGFYAVRNAIRERKARYVVPNSSTSWLLDRLDQHERCFRAIQDAEAICSEADGPADKPEGDESHNLEPNDIAGSHSRNGKDPDSP
jgi:hypothetical protein